MGFEGYQIRHFGEVGYDDIPLLDGVGKESAFKSLSSGAELLVSVRDLCERIGSGWKFVS